MVLFHNSILGNYYFDTYYEVISYEVSCMVESYKKYETLHCKYIIETYYNIVDFNNTNIDLDTNNCLCYSYDENIDQILDWEESVSVNPSPCSTMVKSLSHQESDDNDERDDLDLGYFVDRYPIDVDDCDFHNYSSDYHNMFYLNFDGYEFDLDGSGEKEGNIDEDDQIFSNEILFLDADYQDCTSYVYQDYSDGHNVTKQDKEENIEALYQKMVVMLGSPINYLPYKSIDALNMK